VAVIVSATEAGWSPEGPGDAKSSRAFIGDKKQIHRGPQAFVNDFRQTHVIDPHFHMVDQFQIFVRGTLRIGKQHLNAVTVHYTDAFTPYGPIVCDEGGMTFFNLRARADVDAHWMPESRERMVRRAGRHRVAECRLQETSDAGFAQQSVLVGPEDDGLCVLLTVAGPDKQLPDAVAGGAGRYELVLSGTLAVGSRTLPAHSLLFAPAGERLPARRAGDAGVQLLTAQPPSD
jgi:hypothetical protein